MDATSAMLSAASALAVAMLLGVIVAVIVWRGGRKPTTTMSEPIGGRVRLPARAFERLALVALTLGIIAITAAVTTDDALRQRRSFIACAVIAVGSIAWLVRRGGFLALPADERTRTDERSDHG
ncbi:MAG TPA: hypothetical protein VGF99_07630 [Myxococcota bacterium]